MALVARDLHGKDREDLLSLAKEVSCSILSKQADLDLLIFAMADGETGDGAEIAELLAGCWQPFDDVESYCISQLSNISADRELAAKKRKEKEGKKGS